MSGEPTLSLIISNYNYGEFLFDAVAAALAQTRIPDEIIVIDDCSSDHSRDLIARLAKEAPRVRAIYNTENLGCNRSINAALAVATGDYVCSAGADDPIHDRNFFETALRLCQSHPSASFCYGEHIIRYQSPTASFATPIRMGIAEQPRYFSPADIVRLYRSRDALSVPTSPALWKRSSLVDIGGLRHELSWFADWFVALVFSARNGACHVPGIFQTIRFSPRSFSQAGMAEQEGYRNLLVTLLETLEHPEFADVRDFFRIPSVLSRHGFKLLNLLITEQRFAHYLSFDLLRCAITTENLPYNVNLDQFGADPSPQVLREVTRTVIKNYASILKTQAENERSKGRVSSARTFCRQAADAAPDDQAIATLYKELTADCARWSRIENLR
jgi:glycosyltransferase involved in cell wall biosynthesis